MGLTNLPLIRKDSNFCTRAFPPQLESPSKQICESHIQKPFEYLFLLKKSSIFSTLTMKMPTSIFDASDLDQWLVKSSTSKKDPLAAFKKMSLSKEPEQFAPKLFRLPSILTSDNAGTWLVTPKTRMTITSLKKKRQLLLLSRMIMITASGSLNLKLKSRLKLMW